MKQVPTVFFPQLSVRAYSFPQSWGKGEKGYFFPSLIGNIEQETEFSQKTWIWAEQIHGTEVVVVKHGRIPKSPLKGADGIVTNRRDVLLIVKHADCVPIFLFDRVKRVIGLVHSGWRGTLGKIGLVALHQMMVAFGSQVRDIHIALGPAAQACCYRKPKDSIFTQLPEWQEYVESKDGEIAVNLLGFITQMFREAGIKPGRITDCGICTIHNRDFWSWTRQRDQGEERGMGVSVLGLKKAYGKQQMERESV